MKGSFHSATQFGPWFLNEISQIAFLDFVWGISAKKSNLKISSELWVLSIYLIYNTYLVYIFRYIQYVSNI